MEPLKKILLPVAIITAVLFAVLYFGTPPNSCCEPTKPCDVEAPNKLTSVLHGDSLLLDWEVVNDAQSYLIDVYDVTENSAAIFKNQRTQENSLTLVSDTFDATHLYKTVVSSICNDCIPSTLSRTSETCPIIIEDVIMMTPTCLGAGCPCSGTIIQVDGHGSTSQSFDVPAALQLHKVTLTCVNGAPPTTKTSWFVIQTRIENGNVKYIIPDISHLDDTNCQDEETFSAPVESDCGILNNRGKNNYTMAISTNNSSTAAKIEFTVPVGCEISVTKCNGCQ